jgi:hypothetical protein
MRYSEQQAFNNCPFAYKLAYLDQLAKAQVGEESNDRDFGAAIHAGLEVHYKGGDINAVVAAFSAAFPVNLAGAEGSKTIDNGVECLKRYVAYYKEQDKNWKVLGTEVLGVIEIGGEKHDLHIDLVAENLQGGGIYLWDHKTTGKTPSPTYWKAFEVSGQLSRYAAFVEQRFGQCSGVLINNITFKSLLRKNKYGEGPGLVLGFERQIFQRTKAQVAFWRQSDTEWMALMQMCREANSFPKALNRMCTYCEFFELCMSCDDPQIRELLYTKRINKQESSDNVGEKEGAQ